MVLVKVGIDSANRLLINDMFLSSLRKYQIAHLGSGFVELYKDLYTCMIRNILTVVIEEGSFGIEGSRSEEFIYNTQSLFTANTYMFTENVIASKIEELLQRYDGLEHLHLDSMLADYMDKAHFSWPVDTESMYSFLTYALPSMDDMRDIYNDVTDEVVSDARGDIICVVKLNNDFTHLTLAIDIHEMEISNA